MQFEFYTFYFYFLKKYAIIKNMWEKFEIDTETLFRQISKTSHEYPDTFEICFSQSRVGWSITSNYRKTCVNGVCMWIFEWAIVNIFWFINDDAWTFTSIDWQFNILRFKIYVLKLQHSHLFSDYCYM